MHTKNYLAGSLITLITLVMQRILRSKSFDASDRRSRQRGQALVMVSVGIFFLFGLLGLVVDVGYGYYLKQVSQAAADSAATAAAAAANAAGGVCNGTTVVCNSTGYTCPASPGTISNLDIGCLYAKQNGLGTTSNRSVTMTSGTGATGGAALSYWVKAVASANVPLGFSKVNGGTQLTANAQAIGGVINGGAGGCIYVLDTSGGITASGTGVVSSACGIYVNGNITLSGTVGVNGIGGAKVNVKGAVTNSGSGTVSPLVVMTTAVSDPLASLPTPTYSTTCTNSSSVVIVNQSSYNLPAGVYCAGITIVNSTVNLNPGTFTSGINTSGSTLNFASGTYAFTGGGGLLTSGSNNFNGTGLLLYFSGTAGITGSGSNTFSMTGTTSGPDEGILIFGDRSNGTGSLTFSGGTSSSGTIYVPKGSLTFSGGTSVSPITMALICWDLTFSGSTYINKDTSGSLTGLGSSSGGSYLVQ
jgi:Flp pilus assembly protein TadG